MQYFLCSYGLLLIDHLLSQLAPCIYGRMFVYSVALFLSNYFSILVFNARISQIVVVYYLSVCLCDIACVLYHNDSS